MAGQRGGDDGGAHRRRRSRLRASLCSAFAAVVIVGLTLSGVIATRGGGGRPDLGSTAAKGSVVSPVATSAVSPIGTSAVLPIPAQPATATAPLAPPPRWSAVLAAIDVRRARAWEEGDPGLLRRVYLPGSAELRTDQEMLHGYLRRGFSVRGVAMTYLSVLVESEQRDAVVLRVVDRLGPARAVDQHGTIEPLPRDQPTRHRIVLRLVGDDWRIAAIASV